jgi:hypothetical protein
MNVESALGIAASTTILVCVFLYMRSSRESPKKIKIQITSYNGEEFVDLETTEVNAQFFGGKAYNLAKLIQVRDFTLRKLIFFRLGFRFLKLVASKEQSFKSIFKKHQFTPS